MNSGKLKALAIPLRALIAIAYRTDPSRVVGGPDWIDQSLYDITGGTGNPTDEFPPLVKAMLTSRFALLAHPETRQMEAFTLGIADAGSKLIPETISPNRGPQPQMTVRPGLLLAVSSEVKMYTNLLAGQLGRPVLDQTGLTGRYDFSLTGTFTRDTLPAALRDQLGLKLESTTAPVDVIVVDGIQQPTLDAPQVAASLRN